MNNEHDKRSYQSINYALRPAKAVERKMLCEGIRKLSTFSRLDQYRYIGFGSTYFSDFTLIHRTLGINRMVSIEKSTEDKERFEFNKPFKCIEMKFGLSNEILPTISWDIPTILWLDYDGHLNSSVLDDIGLFCAKAVPSSMIIVSVNAHAESPDFRTQEQPYNPEVVTNEYRMSRLISAVGSERIPLGTKGKDLNLKNKAGVLRKIINNQILETLSLRNGGISDEDKVQYQQIFNFTYQDGAKMLTVGGVLYTADQTSSFNQCGFENLEFFRSGEEAFDIGIPRLTFREIRHIDRKLPPRKDNGDPIEVSSNELGELSAIPDTDIQNYIKIYRYFPNFAETDI